jgi:hypothetical protein
VGHDPAGAVSARQGEIDGAGETAIVLVVSGCGPCALSAKNQQGIDNMGRRVGRFVQFAARIRGRAPLGIVERSGAHHAADLARFFL